MNLNEVFYFNEENISEVLFEGYINESEEKFREFYNIWVKENGDSIPKGRIEGPIE